MFPKAFQLCITETGLYDTGLFPPHPPKKKQQQKRQKKKQQDVFVKH